MSTRWRSSSASHRANWDQTSSRSGEYDHINMENYLDSMPLPVDFAYLDNHGDGNPYVEDIPSSLGSIRDEDLESGHDNGRENDSTTRSVMAMDPLL